MQNNMSQDVVIEGEGQNNGRWCERPLPQSLSEFSDINNGICEKIEDMYKIHMRTYQIFSLVSDVSNMIKQNTQKTRKEYELTVIDMIGRMLKQMQNVIKKCKQIHYKLISFLQTQNIENKKKVNFLFKSISKIYDGAQILVVRYYEGISAMSKSIIDILKRRTNASLPANIKNLQSTFNRMKLRDVQNRKYKMQIKNRNEKFTKAINNYSQGTMQITKLPSNINNANTIIEIAIEDSPRIISSITRNISFLKDKYSKIKKNEMNSYPI
jgi:hypothetical protein